MGFGAPILVIGGDEGGGGCSSDHKFITYPFKGLKSIRSGEILLLTFRHLKALDLEGLKTAICVYDRHSKRKGDIYHVFAQKPGAPHFRLI